MRRSLRTSSDIVSRAMTARLLAGLGRPTHEQIYGPVCDLCNAVVDVEELVEGEPGGLGPDPNGVMTSTPASSRYCKVRVQHHGAEEVHRFDFETVWWSAEDLRRAMQTRRWFCPVQDAGDVAGSNFSAGSGGE